MSTHTNRILAFVASDKGGPGKSLTAAMIYEAVNTAQEPWRLVEIEQKATYTQASYNWPVRPLLINLTESKGGLDVPSLAPFNKLHSLIPDKDEEESRVLIDFGANIYSNFAIWAAGEGGLDPFLQAGYRIITFIPIQSKDYESADFFNAQVATLSSIGVVVPVWNQMTGSKFEKVTVGPDQPGLTIPFVGEPATDELSTGSRRLTYKQLSESSSAARRSRIDAAFVHKTFTESLNQVRKHHSF